MLKGHNIWVENHRFKQSPNHSLYRLNPGPCSLPTSEDVSATSTDNHLAGGAFSEVPGTVEPLHTGQVMRGTNVGNFNFDLASNWVRSISDLKVGTSRTLCLVPAFLLATGSLDRAGTRFSFHSTLRSLDGCGSGRKVCTSQ